MNNRLPDADETEGADCTPKICELGSMDIEFGAEAGVLGSLTETTLGVWLAACVGALVVTGLDEVDGGIESGSGPGTGAEN